jgi:hypothetical protein
MLSVEMMSEYLHNITIPQMVNAEKEKLAISYGIKRVY